MTEKLTMTGLARAIRENTAATRAHVEDCVGLRIENTKAMVDLATTVNGTARIVAGYERTLRNTSRLIRWGGGIVFTAIVTAAVGLYFQGREAHDQTMATVQQTAQHPQWQQRWDDQQKMNEAILEELQRIEARRAPHHP